jgi:serine protease inhibitor
MMEKAGVAIGQEPIKMFFNRPFVYALVDADTGIPLFIGQVNKIR